MRRILTIAADKFIFFVTFQIYPFLIPRNDDTILLLFLVIRLVSVPSCVVFMERLLWQRPVPLPGGWLVVVQSNPGFRFIHVPCRLTESLLIWTVEQYGQVCMVCSTVHLSIFPSHLLFNKCVLIDVTRGDKTLTYRQKNMYLVLMLMKKQESDDGT